MVTLKDFFYADSQTHRLSYSKCLRTILPTVQAGEKKLEVGGVGLFRLAFLSKDFIEIQCPFVPPLAQAPNKDNENQQANTDTSGSDNQGLESEFQSEESEQFDVLFRLSCFKWEQEWIGSAQLSVVTLPISFTAWMFQE